MAYNKIIEQFKDPDDGVERTFSFTGRPDATGEFIEFEVVCTRIGPVSEEGQSAVDQKPFKEYNLFNVITAPKEDGPNPYPFIPAQQLALFSDVMSASGRTYKYSVEFAKDFINDIYVRSNFQAIGEKTILRDNFGGNPEDAYNKFSFRFPLAIAFPDKIARSRQVRSRDMAVFLQSPEVTEALESSFQKISDTSASNVP